MAKGISISPVFGMACFDHHRAEITVERFTGHPLPVRQFVTLPWDLNPVPYFQRSSPRPMEYALPPSLEWHVWHGSEVNIQHEDFVFYCNIARYPDMCEMDIQCSYHIYIEHKNLEIRKTRKDFSVKVRNFLLPLSLKVLRHKERYTYSFYSGFFICPHPYLVQYLPKATSSKRKSTLLVRCTVLNSTDFFKIPKSSARFGCVTSFAPASPVSYLGYCNISE